MSQSRIEQARALFAQFPNNELARFNLAQALCEAGEHREAIEHLTVLTRQKPDWMVAHILLGKSHLALGETERARPVLERALELAIAQHHDGPREELAALLQTIPKQ
ncbi:MAG: tetratricopeptide repeat protein [Verrucomicrobiae bacterium]|nr:tetratricopeptide repeat protein [Verrucomicrobiae bacterium]